MRVDTRPRIDRDVMKGVLVFGAGRLHGIQTETVWRRLSFCGRPMENANGSRKAITCPDCLSHLRAIGYAG